MTPIHMSVLILHKCCSMFTSQSCYKILCYLLLEIDFSMVDFETFFKAQLLHFSYARMRMISLFFPLSVLVPPPQLVLQQTVFLFVSLAVVLNGGILSAKCVAGSTYGVDAFLVVFRSMFHCLRVSLS